LLLCGSVDLAGQLLDWLRIAVALALLVDDIPPVEEKDA
jgi:hypothetical protein